MVDLTGKRFGRLCVLEKIPCCKHTVYKCICDCGNIRYVFSHNLLRGATTSCGCYSQQIKNKIFKTHGLCRTRIYRIWADMKTRCYNPNCKSYANYGGRGIKICYEWYSDFMSFYKWATANNYSDNLTIDRIDYNGDYTPDNCRWLTKQEQNFNKRANFYITYKDETHCLCKWSKMLNINHHTLYSRIKKKGWSVERAFTQPVK